MYSTEPTSTTDTPSDQLQSLRKKVRSAPRALGTLVRDMAKHRNISHAKERTKAVHAAKVDRLTTHRLCHWVDAPENFAQQIDFMRSQLQPAHACLAHKVALLADDVDAQAAVPDHGYQPDPLRKSGAGHAAYVADPARPAPPPWDDPRKGN